MTLPLFSDKDFSSAILRLALPIATQQLVMNALNAVDVLMIGQLGESAVAAVGLANQFFFLLQLFLFGVGSGTAIFTAQFWGRGDAPALRRAFSIGLLASLSGSAVFSVAAVALPGVVLGFYTQDPKVIELGSPYLRLVGLCYVPTAASVIFGMSLRSTQQVKLPMIVSVTALTLKSAVTYLLVFGKLGLPALGIVGAAVGTLTARTLECLAIVGLTYAWNLAPAARARDLNGIRGDFLGRFMRVTLPVVAGEVLWSLGMTTYYAVYARIGTESVAAVNIASTIEGIALVPFLGLGNACAIILGNLIGAGDTQTAREYARRFMVLSVAGAAAMGVVVFVASQFVLGAYRISPETRGLARGVLAVISGVLWLKAANLMMIVGIMRSGGDTRFAFLADTGPLWLLGVPLALVGAFLLHLPVYAVVLMVMSDEATKFIVSLRRVISGRWVNSVARAA